MNSRNAIITGSILMALAVGFGAFGAHIVQDLLSPDRFSVYQTAVEYHFYHALGLLVLGALMKQGGKNLWLARSGYAFTAGILIFSGSLYILTLTDTGWLGAITPVGGALFIGGWLSLGIGIFTEKDASGEAPTEN
ncbi:MAG: DUF423 domain-containing protein [Balneolaceae bacterium]|nr:MAG: DUF423 domain-containing protein [Balneolaceae bacterium]